MGLVTGQFDAHVRRPRFQLVVERREPAPATVEHMLLYDELVLPVNDDTGLWRILVSQE